MMPGAARRRSAYQIVVASKKEAVEAGHADLWDSGKVKSPESSNVPYAGSPLPVSSSVWWAVRTWDKQDQPSPWSVPQKLNIGKAASDEPFYSDDWVDSTLAGTPSKVRANVHPLEVHRIAPISVILKSPGHYFVDFGRAAFGTLNLILTSEADGHEIEIRLGEKRGEGDSVDTSPGGCIVHLTRSLALKRGMHTYKLDLPRYNYGARMPEHIGEVVPFRYCEIINSPSEIDSKNIAQLAVFYHFDESASSFTSSDTALNDVWKLCKYSIKATSFLGIYVDGQRERLPYEADAFINQLGHYCVDREYAMARYSHEHLIHHPTWPTEWILFSVLIAWADYMYTGNAESIKRCYDDLNAKTLLALEREDGLISYKLLTPEITKSIHYTRHEVQRDVVDWPQPSESDGHVMKPINAVPNAFHYRALVLMARMAEVAARPDDAASLPQACRTSLCLLQRQALRPQDGHLPRWRGHRSFVTALEHVRTGVRAGGRQEEAHRLSSSSRAVAWPAASTGRSSFWRRFTESARTRPR